MTAPSHYSPAYVCARIRKLLAAKGWPLRKVARLDRVRHLR